MAQKDRRPAQEDLSGPFTVTYRSVSIAVAVVLGLGGGAIYFYSRAPMPISRAVPVPRVSATTARFTSIEGNVLVRKARTFDWVAANKSMLLNGGDLIRATAGATAEITCFDGTVIQLRPGALMTLEKTFEDLATKARTVAARLSSGAGTIQTTRKNVPSSTTELMTPTLKSTFDEMSQAAVDVAETGESDLRLFQGSVRAETRGGQKIRLDASEGLKVNAAGQAGPKVSLPIAPTLVAPPHQTEITHPDPTHNTTLLVWKPVRGAVAYHLLLDQSAYFNRPLVNDRGIHQGQQEIRGLDAGKYYWRVSAIDKDGTEGPFSAFFGFTVARASSEPIAAKPPFIESLDVRSNILQIKGKTEPGGTITVNGQRVDVGVDGSFNDYVTLEKGGKQIVVIRATGLNGGVYEERRSVVVSAP